MKTLSPILPQVLLGASLRIPEIGFARPTRPEGLVAPPETYRVGAFGSGGDFATLQAAIDASGDRDTIQVSTDAVHPVRATIRHLPSIIGGHANRAVAAPGSDSNRITRLGASRPLTGFNAGVAYPTFRLTGRSISGGGSSNGWAIHATGNMELALHDLTRSGTRRR